LLPEELSLIRQARGGDRKAFRTLVERHQQRIFWLAYDLTGDMQDAEDLSQETFVRMFRSLGSFRGEAKLSSWLHRITVNIWISTRRRGNEKLREMEQPLEDELVDNIADRGGSAESNPERQADSGLKRKLIQKALDRLSDRERAVFVMRHFHGSKTAEIGRALDLSAGTIKALHFRAIKKMRNSLGHLSTEI
jgi:RNA polymerase sigma-70 factor, ECF subfamily